MMSEASSGLLVSVRRLFSTLIAVASTRLELLANELSEERLHLEQMLLYFFAALFLLSMAIVLMTGFVVVLFWDTHRLAVLGWGALLFFVPGIAFVVALRRMMQRKSKLFSVSLAELVKDADQLGGGNG